MYVGEPIDVRPIIDKCRVSGCIARFSFLAGEGVGGGSNLRVLRLAPVKLLRLLACMLGNRDQRSQPCS